MVISPEYYPHEMAPCSRVLAAGDFEHLLRKAATCFTAFHFMTPFQNIAAVSLIVKGIRPFYNLVIFA